MASPDTSATGLRALSRLQIGSFSQRLPQPHADLRVSVIEPLRVLSLRCIPGSAEALSFAAGVAELPGPGSFQGSDPLLVWRNPSEWLHIGTHDEPADALLRALPVGGPAQATDLSAGLLVVEVRGAALDALLARLLDAGVQVGQPGQATRARLADIAVVAMRVSEQRVWLLVDRANDHYLADWLSYASEAALLASST